MASRQGKGNKGMVCLQYHCLEGEGIWSDRAFPLPPALLLAGIMRSICDLPLKAIQSQPFI